MKPTAATNMRAQFLQIITMKEDSQGLVDGDVETPGVVAIGSGIMRGSPLLDCCIHIYIHVLFSTYEYYDDV